VDLATPRPPAGRIAARLTVLWRVTCLLSSCGTTSSGNDPTTPTSSPDPGHTLVLARACPGVHLAYDALVASDPASTSAFEESVRRLSEIGVDETRTALAPVLDAAGTLAKADREAFPQARDGVYAAISRLSATCATLGAPILH
jgi:hypothetical protein